MPRAFPQAPSFDSFSIEIALPLKAGLWSDVFRGQSLTWAEKLMRFCEVWHAELPARTRAKWQEEPEARQGLLELAVLFLECHRAVADLRYVNSALKLLDLPGGESADSPAALLFLRAVTQSEAVLRQLEGST